MKKQILIPTLLLSFGLNAFADSMAAADKSLESIATTDEQTATIDIEPRDTDSLIEHQDLLKLGSNAGNLQFKSRKMECLDTVVSVVYAEQHTAQSYSNEFIGVCPSAEMGNPLACLTPNTDLKKRCNAGLRKLMEIPERENLLQLLVDQQNQATENSAEEKATKEVAATKPQTCNDIEVQDVAAFESHKEAFKALLEDAKQIPDQNGQLQFLEDNKALLLEISDNFSTTLEKYSALSNQKNAKNNQIFLSEANRIKASQETGAQIIIYLHNNITNMGHSVYTALAPCMTKIQQKAEQEEAQEVDSESPAVQEMGTGETNVDDSLTTTNAQ